MTAKDASCSSRRGGSDTPYDAVVIGGGPAGSATAAHLARRGRRVLVVERERFPRFHVGESLIPQTNRYLKRLGVYDAIAAAGFPVKRGAFLLGADGDRQSYADFARAEGVEPATTWEVPRDRFDQILLDHAAASGAEVWQESRVTDVELGGEGGVSATIRSAEHGTRTVRALTLVDASGRDGFLAKRLKLRRVDPDLRNVGIHAWYEGVVPPPDDCAGDVRLVTMPRAGWGWLIPLDDRVTSVGVVVSRERHASLPTASPERCLDRILAETPALEALLAPARRISPVRVDGDYSYATRTYAGDRWLLVGDAGSFLDPVFSTGVLLALSSGIDAAEAIDEGLERGDLRRSFAAYDRAQRREYSFFRRYVTGFYRPEFRDLLLRPGDRFGMSDAVVTVLAGNTRPSLPKRMRLELFFLAVSLQRHLDLAPRLHGPDGSMLSADAPSDPPGEEPRQGSETAGS